MKTEYSPAALLKDAMAVGLTDGAIHDFKPSIWDSYGVGNAYRDAYDQADLARPLTVEHVLSYARALLPSVDFVACCEVGSPYKPAILQDKRGRVYLAPVCTWGNLYCFRSILRRRVASFPAGYLPNGQPGKNSVLVEFYGEQNTRGIRLSRTGDVVSLEY